MSSTVAVFDWDGVVIDSSTAHEHAWQSLAKEENLPLVPNHFKLGFGKLNEVIIPNILGWSKDPQEIRRLSEKKEAHYRTIARTGHIRLLPGVKELTNALKSLGIPCVIGTSTHKANLALSFELFGLEGHFQGAVSSEDVTQGKPNPEVFLKACALAGGDPRKSFVFEDSFSGIQAGLAGGFTTIALATTHTREILLAQNAHHIVNNLSEVNPQWILKGKIS